MLKKQIEECIELTDRIMVNHYRGSSDVLYGCLDDECLWIGSCASEYYMGKEEIITVLDNYRGNLPMITLKSKEYHCVAQDRSSCTIVGRYIGITDEDSGEVFSDMQRVTFCWKKKEEQLWLKHIHVSNPLTILKKDEVFPHEVGKYTKRYMDVLIQKETDKLGTINVKDRDGISHKLQVSRIIYLEAFNVHTMIHTTTGDIYARILLSELEERLAIEQPELFVRVHKSFCVSKHYIENTRRYEVQMQGGHTVPISKNRYQQIKEQLQLQ